MTTDIRPEVDYHLRHNHYPPAPAWMHAPAQAVIDAGPEQDLDDELSIPLDDGVVLLVRKRDLVKAFHLHTFWEDDDPT